MQNIYQSALNKKNRILENLTSENNNYFKIKEILKNGNYVYLKNNFNFERFINKISILLQNNLKLSCSNIDHSKSFIEVKYKSNTNIASKIIAPTSFSALFYNIENILIFTINQSNYFDNKFEKSSKFNFSKFINASYKKEISQLIYKTIYEDLNPEFQKNIIDFKNSFIEKTETSENLFLLNIFNSKTILAKLNLSNFKCEDIEITSKIHKSFFAVSESNIGIFAFNKNNELLIFEELKEKFIIKKGITSNTITYKNLSWETKRGNSKIFNKLKDILNFNGSERVKEFARLNYLSENFEISKKLISQLKNNTDSAEYDFLYLLSNIKLHASSNIPDEEIKPLIKNILSEEKINNKVVEISKKWKISNAEKTLLLELFIKTSETNEERKAIIPLFDIIRKEFKKKNKDLINQTVFEINYAEFLILSGKNRKARKILKSLLKNLPNESISDILPSQDLDLTSEKSGQLLKIKIYELLTIAKGRSEAENEILQSAKLQPLNIEVLDKLKNTKTEVIKNKALEIISLLEEGGLSNIEKEVPVKKYHPLPHDIIENKLRHPATLKNGNFYSIQKWISIIKTDDYSSVKEYAEKIEATNYPKLNEIFYNLKQIFSIEEIDFFISRGEKSNDIIGYEGTPPFVLIGFKHIDKNSKLFLNFKELQFAVAVELAHIFFKHSKISANDVWRGVADKGYVLIDAILGIVPVAGLADKSIRSANKLSAVTKVLDNSFSIGKNIYEASNKVSDFYKNKFKTNSKTEKKQKLLAASRLMQYTADRAGLAISGDIKSAVRSMFLTGKYNYTFFDNALETSLKDFILQKNEDGTYKNQEIALRISHLISFYLSDEYSQVRKILLEEKKVIPN